MRKVINGYSTVLKNSFYLGIIDVIRLLMPIISISYVLKTVGTEKYGMIVFAQSIISFMAVVVNYGIEFSAVKYVSENRNNAEMLSKIVTSVYVLKTILFTISSTVIISLIFSVDFFLENRILYVFALVSCLSDVLLPTWFFQGVERMKYITLMQLSSIILYVISLFLFVRIESDYIYIPLLQSLSLVFSSLLGVWLLLKYNSISFVRIERRDVYQLFKVSTPYFFSRASLVVNGTIAKIVGGITLGMSDVAYFDIAQTVIGVAQMPIQVINRALFPHVSNKKNKNESSLFFIVIIAISLVVTLCVYFISGFAINLVMPNLINAVPYIKVYSIAIILGAISIYCGVPTLVAYGYSKPFNRSILYSTVVIVLAYILILTLKIESLLYFVLVAILGELTISSYRFYYCLKFKIIDYKYLYTKSKMILKNNC